MSTSSPLRRTVAIALTAAAVGAVPAAARQSDMPLRPDTPAADVSATPSAPTTPTGIPARVESMGVSPVAGATPAPATAPVSVSLAKPDNGSGFDWLSAGIGAAVLIAIALAVLVARTTTLPARMRHPFTHPPTA
jgi:hypothetical protein